MSCGAWIHPLKYESKHKYVHFGVLRLTLKPTSKYPFDLELVQSNSVCLSQFPDMI